MLSSLSPSRFGRFAISEMTGASQILLSRSQCGTCNRYQALGLVCKMSRGVAWWFQPLRLHVGDDDGAPTLLLRKPWFE